MVLTAKQAFKNSQKGAIREAKKMKKICKKEFRLAMKKIREAARQGETETDIYFHFTISYLIEAKLNKLGYKIKYHYNKINISWEDAGTSVTGREGEVSA